MEAENVSTSDSNVRSGPEKRERGAMGFRRGFCVHRWAIVKRWTDAEGFHALQKCRRCQLWKRSDIAMSTKHGLFEKHDAYDRPQNDTLTAEIPTEIGLSDGNEVSNTEV